MILATPDDSAAAARRCEPPAKPTQLQPQDPVPAGTVRLMWQAASGAVKYAVRVDDTTNPWNGNCNSPNPGDICNNNVTGTHFDFTAQPGRTYSFWIHSLNACGHYSPHAGVQFETCSTPSAPTNPQPSGQVPQSSAQLSWDAVAGAEKYWVRVDNTANGWNGSCANPNPGDFCDNDVTGTTFDFPAASGANYGYWIHAVNQCGEYSPSVAGSFSVTCAPQSCAQAGVSCGPAPDGCGGALDCGECPAADLPAFSVTQQGIQELKFNHQNFGYQPEIVPVTVSQTNGPDLMMISSAWTFLCESWDNVLDSSPADPHDLLAQDCELVTRPTILEEIQANGSFPFRSPGEVVGTLPDYKRGYYGMLNLQRTDDKLLGFVHGEHRNLKNLNELGELDAYQGTIYPGVDVESCWFNYDKNNPSACWDSFASFASLVWSPAPGGTWSGQEFVDVGPVMWPNPPYMEDGVRKGSGYYHSQGFTDDHYAYIYTVSSASSCTVMARAPLSSVTEPTAWRNYYTGDPGDPGDFEQTSLPADFDKDAENLPYSTPGGEISCLVNDNALAIWFHVARIAGTPYYLAAEEREVPASGSDPTNNWQMGIRLSADLVNWSPITVLRSTGEPWGSGDFSYPTLYNKDGGQDSGVDADELYIVGNHPGDDHRPRSMRLMFDCSTPSAPLHLTSSVSSATGVVTLDWDEPQHAAFYWLRIDDTQNGFSSDCDNPNPGDLCSNRIVSPPFSFQGTPGQTYGAWVHAVNMCGTWSGDTSTSFSVP